MRSWGEERFPASRVVLELDTVCFPALNISQFLFKARSSTAVVHVETTCIPSPRVQEGGGWSGPQDSGVTVSGIVVMAPTAVAGAVWT